MRKIVAAAAAIAAMGCTGSRTPASPTAPVAVVVQTPAPSAPPPTPAATLAFTEFTSRVFPPDQSHPYYSYETRLTLSETGGRSAATISAIDLTVPGGEGDSGCTDNYPFTIEAGGTWTLQDDYCQPLASSLKPQATLSITVQFTDDKGVKGTLSATAPIAQ